MLGHSTLPYMLTRTRSKPTHSFSHQDEESLHNDDDHQHDKILKSVAHPNFCMFARSFLLRLNPLSVVEHGWPRDGTQDAP